MEDTHKAGYNSRHEKTFLIIVTSQENYNANSIQVTHSDFSHSHILFWTSCRTKF
jgi:hypothetical protein